MGRWVWTGNQINVESRFVSLLSSARSLRILFLYLVSHECACFRLLSNLTDSLWVDYRSLERQERTRVDDWPMNTSQPPTHPELRLTGRHRGQSFFPRLCNLAWVSRSRWSNESPLCMLPPFDLGCASAKTQGPLNKKEFSVKILSRIKNYYQVYSFVCIK